jgi:hypothetical protein
VVIGFRINWDSQQLAHTASEGIERLDDQLPMIRALHLIRARSGALTHAAEVVADIAVRGEYQSGDAAPYWHPVKSFASGVPNPPSCNQRCVIGGQAHSEFPSQHRQVKYRCRRFPKFLHERRLMKVRMGHFKETQILFHLAVLAALTAAVPITSRAQNDPGILKWFPAARCWPPKFV